MGFKHRSHESHSLHNKEDVLALTTQTVNIGGSDVERELKASRENYIKAKLLRHEHVAFNWAVGHVLSDGTSRRVNGQHSSQVFLDTKDEEWELYNFPIVINIDHYDCDTPRDRAYLFNQFDPPQSGRNREDQIGVHLALHEAIKGMDRYAAHKATSGLLWYLKQVEGYNDTSAKAQFDLLHQNGEIHRFLQYCDSLRLDKRKTAEMGLRPVIAAMFHTTRKANPEGEEFWRRVSGGTGSIGDTDSIEYKLAEFLDKARDPHPQWATAERNKFKNKTKANDIEIFQTCLRLYAAKHRNLTRVEMIERIRESNLREVVARYWPLPDMDDIDTDD